jgi:predicted amidophosphoribosyltransferase
MPLSELEFGSFLAYTPRPTLEPAKVSKNWMYQLKTNALVGHPPQTMAGLIAQRLADRLDELPFKAWLNGTAVAIPVPKSTLARPGSLWVPYHLCEALREAGLVADVAVLLERIQAVPKAATSLPQNRATVEVHYRSLGVRPSLAIPSRILLVDDIITRGATLYASALRLVEAFPTSQIQAFAAMRTISDEALFKGISDPCRGNITRHGDQTHREP